MKYNEVTAAFIRLSERPTDEVVKTAKPTIERFSDSYVSQNQHCSEFKSGKKSTLYTKREITRKHIPPPSAALIQHIKRAMYQAGYCWGQCLEPFPEMPSPSEWGWKRSEPQLWEPL